MSFTDASTEVINTAMSEAQEAFQTYKLMSGKRKGGFLRAIVAELESLKEAIVASAVAETNLPEPRIAGEFGRTIGQLKMFAALVEDGSWVDVRIDTAIPDRAPAPRPDIRKMLVPVGPVVVFGASNFPLAFSTAGGDTASALAAGCPVIVKGHPAHGNTSQMVAECILRAVANTGMPKGVFAHVHGKDFAVGKALVMHPYTKAVAFTGSYMGGKALFDMANARQEPVPVFSEMGSTNPVFLLPEAVKNRPEEIAAMYAGSITLSAGQFCTNPGLLLGVKNDATDAFAGKLGALLQAQAPAPMLHQGIAASYSRNRSEALKQKGVQVVAEAPEPSAEIEGRPTLATVSLEDFVSNRTLAEEVFGPYSLLVQGDSIDALEKALELIPGQLTATIIGEAEELPQYAGFISKVREKAGRVIINGIPTGVEVCPSMQHGGPFPATTDARFTSVGTDAIKRFVRPVSFQNFPDAMLPQELQNGNPLKVWRLVNSEWTQAAVA